ARHPSENPRAKTLLGPLLPAPAGRVHQSHPAIRRRLAAASPPITATLQELLERLQVVELILRLSKDMRLISTKQYAQVVELTEEVGKQATGWKKHSAASPAV